MYSPAALPSRQPRGARRRSAGCRPTTGISSSTTPCGLPTFAVSTSAQLVGVLLERVGELEQHLRALAAASSRATPRTRVFAASTARSTSAWRAARHLGDRLAGRRVQDLLDTALDGVDPLAADVVLRLHARRAHATSPFQLALRLGRSKPAAPVVDLLPELQVDEALGRDDAVERADAVDDVEQVAPVGAEDLDEEVELAGGDDHVARLAPGRDRVGHRLGRPVRLDPEHRLRLEAEAERVGDAGDLEDVLAAEARVAVPDRRLGDAELRRDLPERLAAVRLERLDDLPVEAVERAQALDGAALGRGSAGPVCEGDRLFAPRLCARVYVRSKCPVGANAQARLLARAERHAQQARKRARRRGRATGAAASLAPPPPRPRGSRRGSRRRRGA